MSAPNEVNPLIEAPTEARQVKSGKRKRSNIPSAGTAPNTTTPAIEEQSMDNTIRSDSSPCKKRAKNYVSSNHIKMWCVAQRSIEHCDPTCPKLISLKKKGYQILFSPDRDVEYSMENGRLCLICGHKYYESAQQVFFVPLAFPFATLSLFLYLGNMFQRHFHKKDTETENQKHQQQR